MVHKNVIKCKRPKVDFSISYYGIKYRIITVTYDNNIYNDHREATAQKQAVQDHQT